MKKKIEVVPVAQPHPLMLKEHWTVFLILHDGKEESFPIEDINITELMDSIEKDGDEALIIFKANFEDFYMVKWGNVKRMYFKNIPAQEAK